MSQCIDDVFQTFLNRFRTSRKIDDQCLSSDSGSCTAQHCSFCDRHAVCTHCLRDSRYSALNNFFGCLRCTLAPGAHVEDCVIMNDTTIGEGAELKNVILDKNVTVRPGAKLIGTRNNPIVIKRGDTV